MFFHSGAAAAAILIPTVKGARQTILPGNCADAGIACQEAIPGEKVGVGMITPCKDADGNPYYEPYSNKVTWIKPSSPPVGVTLSQVPDQLVTNHVDNEYYATTESTPPGSYQVYYVSTNSEHCNGWYFNYYIDVIPKITSDVPGEVLWFFSKGVNPTGWPTSTFLTATPGASSYTWNIVEGAGAVQFSNGGKTITTSNPKTKLVAIAGSLDPYDVSVTVTATDGSYSVTSDPIELEVNTPKYATRISTKDKKDSTYAYDSLICYKLLDQFKSPLPSDRTIGINEKFTTDIVIDYVGSNWRRHDPGGADQFSSNSCDEIQGEASMFIPTPLAPQDPRGKVKINHWKGNWMAGSTTPGEGAIVIKALIWQKYQDHGRHE